MKKFAFYLPQFHEIPENDEWWGKGFTEWVNVKAAKSLYKDHNQPVIPANDYYYNLLDKDTVKWQTELMKNYGINGFIYYHYYFEGKKLLEKPAENLLSWKDIDQSFFFCWANHSWVKRNGKNTTVLIEQSYGDEKEWEDHFMYLLPFFKDSRYEKKNNKPIFMLFVSDFKEAESMMAYFDKRCKECHFDGICVIETVHKINSVNNAQFIDYHFYREPRIGLDLYKQKFSTYPHRVFWKVCRLLGNKLVQRIGAERFDANKLYESSMKIIKYTDKNVIPGLFFSWDNTPRHNYYGYVIDEVNRETFFKYIKLVSKSEFLFINAWNEWAEGMVLEPTVHNGYKYLEWMKEASQFLQNS